MKKSKDFISKISGIGILLASLFNFFEPKTIFVPIVMAVCVIAFTIITAKSPYPGKSIRGKRLFSFQIFSCILMMVATYFMFCQKTQWVIIMLIAAVFLVYSAFVLPKELEKEKKSE